jgi:GntR family transcriptional regulator/MocR family aminotransferase
MPKVTSTFELSLKGRTQGQTLEGWLYGELRAAILDGRLKPGVRLPASRELARRYGLSRGTVVSALERLQGDGYLSTRIGLGTWVNGRADRTEVEAGGASKLPGYVQRAVSEHKPPRPFIGWVDLKGHRPFRMRDPALAEFPAQIWGRLAARRARTLRSWLRDDDRWGYRPLREAIAHYLGSSRGVRCGVEQIQIVSGVQQALDLLCRLLTRPGDPVWMEDPGYFGASIAFERAGARIIPVPVDEHGLCVAAGRRACTAAKGVYLTPAHQFPLGMVMSHERRAEVLRWAHDTGAFIIEDDYDSEYRFDAPPEPALQGMDRGASVIFIGTFTKLLFPSLRLGYVVLPPPLIDPFVSYRLGTELCWSGLDQAVLCDFIAEGHLGRHLRRMRALYARRREALADCGRRHLEGIVEISDVQAGL